MRKALEILLLFLVILLAAAIPAIVLLEPELPFQISIKGKEEPPAPQMPPDMQRYFELKNTSCEILSRDFLIVTHDVVEGTMEGLVESIPGERSAAEGILAGYSFNQTTKTYVRGEHMKRVLIANDSENMTIWKEGRAYECRENCTMRLMDIDESAEFYDKLWEMKINCAYFGKTSLPASVDMNSLIEINRTGLLEVGYYSCENFLISGNKSYAESVLETEELDEDQRALLWALAHLEGPVQECLGVGTGIIVYRNLTLDLTDAYRFSYSPGGYMRVNQQTTLEYFTDNVPESFLRLPD